MRVEDRELIREIIGYLWAMVEQNEKNVIAENYAEALEEMLKEDDR